MQKLRDKLLEDYKIFTITVRIPAPEKGQQDIVGMRVTPSIYTPLKDLDLFIDAVTKYIRNGFPS